VNFPRICLIQQDLVDRSLKDIPAETRRQLERADFASLVRPGARIAIGAGSRGIANIAAVVGEVVKYWQARGCRPFIFPAMGSHGSATAEGQAQVLAGYGITEAAMGCPIVSSLEVVSTGRTPEGIETYMDRQACESDGVMLVNRVKWHTDFTGSIESGLIKMAAIGIGKLAGAHQYHTAGVSLGLEQVIRSVFRRIAGSGKILGGLAILEDARHGTARLEALRTEELEAREAELLALAKSWMARIPVESLDLLIVDEMGKAVSGTGMDTKVVNRSIEGPVNCFPGLVKIQRIYVRDFSPHSDGNAVGVGMADIISDRLMGKINWQATYMNAVTAGHPEGAKAPMHFPTDRRCLEAIAQTVGKADSSQMRIGWITDTLQLGAFGFSENLLPEVQANPALHVVSPAMELPFDRDGALPKLRQLAAALAG
jgi:acyl-CoA synthetase (AMP-forming)/AMP-acid ligase II